VDVVTRLRVGWQKNLSSILVGAKVLQCETGHETHTDSCHVLPWAPPAELKRSGHKADHSPSPTDEVKNA
jgi:hypothetical protein